MKKGEIEIRGIVSMVERWSPKPEVKGSNPFSPDPFLFLLSRLFFLEKIKKKKTKARIKKQVLAYHDL